MSPQPHEEDIFQTTKFLKLAGGSADLILTGDKDLLALHPFREIAILTPMQFLER